MSKETKHGSGAAEGARRATGAGPEPNLSRKHGVTAATLTGWREAFLRGGEGGLKSRELDLGDEEKQRLKSVVSVRSQRDWRALGVEVGVAHLPAVPRFGMNAANPT